MPLRHARREQTAPAAATRLVVLVCLLVVGCAALSSAAGAKRPPGGGSAAAFGNPFHSPLLNADPPASQQAILASVLNNNASLTSCKPTGQISDARCDYETVEMDINSDNFFPILDKLRRETFFRLYKVDLYRDCPFWNDNSLCMSPDCTVSKVDESDIPTEFRSASLSSVKTTSQGEVDSRSQSSAHNHDHSHNQGSPVPADTCQCAETDFCHWEDEDWSPESSWVDLIDNPERFTGYTGTSAHRVWRSIYEENCFGVARPTGSSSANQAKEYRLSSSKEMDRAKAAEALSSLLSGQTKAIDPSSSEAEQCLEKRVFYKLISGLHASISIHICHDYLDQSTGEWSPNLSCFVERIAQHPERLQNLYFTHAVLVRSLAKLGERLGFKGRGKIAGLVKPQTKELMRLAPGLPSSSSTTAINLASLLQQAVNTPPTFDEASMFDQANPESEFLRTEFRDRFRNVSRIMDCVGCDKCRLWGKLQTNGLGTALKILFEGNQLIQQRLLQRSELVAIINTIHRVSESIRAVESFRNMYQDEVQKHKEERSGLDAAQRGRNKQQKQHHSLRREQSGKQSERGTGQGAAASSSTPRENPSDKSERVVSSATTTGATLAGGIPAAQQQQRQHVATISLPLSLWRHVRTSAQHGVRMCAGRLSGCLSWTASLVSDASARSNSSHARSSASGGIDARGDGRSTKDEL